VFEALVAMLDICMQQGQQVACLWVLFTYKTPDAVLCVCISVYERKFLCGLSDPNGIMQSDQFVHVFLQFCICSMKDEYCGVVDAMAEEHYQAAA
jgi:hypothetical protein